MKARTNPNQSILLTHLARKILAQCVSYASKTEYYARWERHHGIEGVEELRGYVSREHANFRSWCALLGRTGSWSEFSDYLTANPACVLNSDCHDGLQEDFTNNPILQSKVSVPVAPWWSDLPWCAPNSSVKWSGGAA